MTQNKIDLGDQTNVKHTSYHFIKANKKKKGINENLILTAILLVWVAATIKK